MVFTVVNGEKINICKSQKTTLSWPSHPSKNCPPVCTHNFRINLKIKKINNQVFLSSVQGWLPHLMQCCVNEIHKSEKTVSSIPSQRKTFPSN